MNKYKNEQIENAKKFKASLGDNKEKEYAVYAFGKKWNHFLKNTKLNLWEKIRNDACNYFSDPVKKLQWHTNTLDNNPEIIPEGNMLSSQVSCVNHLFLLRKNQDYASAVLRNIDKRIVSAEIVCDGYGDDGYIEFESWGTKENNNPLNEKSPNRERGKNSTSIDAVMVGRKDDGNNILILMEWKYTEDYKNRDKCNYVYINGKERNRLSGKKDGNDCMYKNKCNNGIQCKYNATDKNEYHIYHKYFYDDNCPIKKDVEFLKNFINFYFDPFYQLMRQTLWGWKSAKEFGCDEYIHLHIIPKENQKFRIIKSEFKSGELPDVWKNLLKDPCRYKVRSPEELLSPLKDNQDLIRFFDYLKIRYLEKYV
jgi:hypothetical protein